MDISIFRAYDVRGIYPIQINEKVVADITKALIKYFKPKAKHKKPKIVVGYDARLSSPILYRSVLKRFKIQDLRFKIYEAGIITTPMIYFLVNYFKAQGGIMITASHNPKNYNGLKVIKEKAIPFSGKEIKKLIINN